MLKNTILFSFIFALLLFGCAGAGEITEEAEEEDVTGPVVTPPGEEEVPEEEEPSAEPEEAGDFIGLDYAGVIALGVPVECDVSYTENGDSMDYKVYMDGSQNFRLESSDVDFEEECPLFVYVSVGNNLYIGCQGAKYPPGSTCDWLTIAGGDEGDAAADATTYEAPDFEAVPLTKVDCRPWLVDQSKFQTPGRVCTMEDFIQEMTQGAYDY